MYVDGHCHLTDDRFDPDRKVVLARAREAGVDLILTVGTTVADSRLARDLAHDHDIVYATAGVHPHEAQSYGPVALAEVLRLSHEPKVLAIGEIGLDYHHEHSPRDRQQAVFRELVKAAVQVERPVVVHSRAAEEDTLDILEEEGKGKVRGVLHCFTGTLDQARRALDLGLYLSFSAILTYPGTQALRAVMKEIPSDRLLLETDAPYLAPQPVRGERNEPARVLHLYRSVARARGIRGETLARRMRENFKVLYRPNQA